MQGIKKETYKQGMTSQEAWKYIKSIGAPVLILLISLFTISLFETFGYNLLAPLTAAMWIVGVVEGIIMASMRKEILNQTLSFIGIYHGTMLALRALIRIVSNVSSEQIQASYNQVITMSQSSAIPGYLQNILWMTAVGVPLGYFGMQIKRFFQFKKMMSKEKALRRYRDIR